MGEDRRTVNTEGINAWWTEDGVCVEMPEDLMEELERILRERYGIGLREVLRQYLRWIAEKPEEFTRWVKECGEYGPTA